MRLRGEVKSGSQSVSLHFNLVTPYFCSRGRRRHLLCVLPQPQPLSTMSTTDDSPSIDYQNSPHTTPTTAESVADAVEKLSLAPSDNQGCPPAAKAETDSPPRLLIRYTRKHLLLLSKSPLVKVPDGMPTFKSWFG